MPPGLSDGGGETVTDPSDYTDDGGGGGGGGDSDAGGGDDSPSSPLQEGGGAPRGSPSDGGGSSGGGGGGETESPSSPLQEGGGAPRGPADSGGDTVGGGGQSTGDDGGDPQRSTPPGVGIDGGMGAGASGDDTRSRERRGGSPSSPLQEGGGAPRGGPSPAGSDTASGGGSPTSPLQEGGGAPRVAAATATGGAARETAEDVTDATIEEGVEGAAGRAVEVGGQTVNVQSQAQAYEQQIIENEPWAQSPADVAVTIEEGPDGPQFAAQASRSEQVSQTERMLEELAGETADELPASVGTDDVQFEEGDDGTVRATLSEEAQRTLAQQNVAESVPGVEPDDVALQPTEEGYSIDQEATAANVAGADEPSEPGVVAQTVGDAGQAWREYNPGADVALSTLATSLRTEEGLELGGISLPGGQDVEAAQAQFEPAAQEIDQAAGDAIGGAGDAVDWATQPLGNPAAPSVGARLATTDFVAGAVGRGARGAAEALNPARAAQDALQVGEYTVRGTEAATGDDAAQALQTGGEAAVTLGELAVEEGAPAAADAAREDPQGAAAVGVGGGIVLGAGLASGAALSRAPSAIGRAATEAPGLAQRGASRTLSSAQRTGRRIARSDRRPSVELVEDPDAGLVQVETPDVPSASGLGDLDLPSPSGYRRAAGQRLAGYSADADLAMQRAAQGVRNLEAPSRPSVDTPSVGAAREAVGQRALGYAVDADLAMQRAARGVRGIEAPSRPSASGVSDAVRMRALGLAADTDLAMQRVRAAPRRAGQRVGLAGQRTRDRLSDFGTDLSFEFGEQTSRPFMADTGTGRATPWAVDAGDFDTPSVSPPDVSVPRPGEANVDELVEGLAAGAPTRAGVRSGLPSRPSVDISRPSLGFDRPTGPDIDNWRDATLRVDFAGGADDADQVVDVEDLRPPGADAGTPDYQRLEVEGYEPGTSIPDRPAGSENTLTGSGQVLQTRQRAASVGDDTTQQLDELEDAATLGDLESAGAATTATAGAAERLDAAQTPGVEVGGDLAVGEEAVSDVVGEGVEVGQAGAVEGIGEGIAAQTGTQTFTEQIAQEELQFGIARIDEPEVARPYERPPPIPQAPDSEPFSYDGDGLDSDEALFESGIQSGEEAFEAALGQDGGSDDVFGSLGNGGDDVQLFEGNSDDFQF